MQEEIAALANNLCGKNGQFTGERLYKTFRAGTRYFVVIQIQTDYSLLCKPLREIFVE